MIEFGRKARGQRRPEAFDFLGFTHICGFKRNGRGFQLWRMKAINRQLQCMRTLEYRQAGTLAGFGTERVLCLLCRAYQDRGDAYRQASRQGAVVVKPPKAKPAPPNALTPKAERTCRDPGARRRSDGPNQPMTSLWSIERCRYDAQQRTTMVILQTFWARTLDPHRGLLLTHLVS